MKNKINKKIKVDFYLVKTGTLKRSRVFNALQKTVAIFSLIALTFVWSGIYQIQTVKAAGLDDVAITLSVETVSAASQVTVVFTFGTLGNGDSIDIYLGEDTGGDQWGLNSVTTADISCDDDGTGETYTIDSVAAATASLPLKVGITATTVGAGAAVVTCLVGDGTPNPTNPSAADGYSVTVVTTSDSGAGIAYVGNANDVTVSVDVLPNLSLTIDNPDATNCTLASGVTTCNLGTVLTTTIATGNYDVNVGTNAANGATLQIAEDGNLRNGGNSITDFVEDSGTITAGTDEYGITVAADAAWTKAGIYTDDASPIATGPVTVATTSAPIDIAGNDITITHQVAIDSTVVGLTYSHIVTWTATANF